MAKQPLENAVHHLFQAAARIEFRTLSDQQLLQRYINQRDELAMGELLRRHEKMVWNVCWRTLRHRQDVEDAFQASLMTLIQKASAILGTKSIEGWLYSVSYKMAINAKVARIRRQNREERRAKMQEENFESHDASWELHEALDKELITIPEKYRNPLILCYLEGLTWSEASQRLSISPESLKWRLERGREMLKTRLSKRGLNLGMSMLSDLSSGSYVKEVPPEVVAKTLDMMRILTMSQGALNAAGVSPQVALLAQSAWGVWTLKMKILLGALLLTLIGVSGGVVKYAGWLSLRSEQPDQGIPGPAKQEGEQPDKQPPRTDRFGDPLPAGALERLGTTRFRMDKFISGYDRIAVTPDKKLYVFGNTYYGRPGNLSLDLQTGKPVHQFQDAYGQFIPLTEEVRLSFDGRLLAQRIKPGGDFGFWNLTTHEPLDLRMTSQPHQIALSRDGKMVAVTTKTPDKDGLDLHIWDNTAGRYLWMKKDKNRLPLQFQFYFHFQLAFSSDGKILLALCPPEFKQQAIPKELLVRRWEVATGKELPRWSVPHHGPLAWSYDASTLAVSTRPTDRTICIWNMVTGQEIRQIELGAKVRLEALALSPDGQRLAAGTRFSEQGKQPFLGVWDTATGKLLRRWDSPIAVTCLVFSQDGQWLVSLPMGVLTNRSIQIRNVESGKIVNQEWHDRGHNDEITSLAFSRQGHTLTSCGRSGGLTLWNAAAGTDGHAMHPLQPRNGLVWGSRLGAVAPNGKVAAYAGRRQIHIWETAEGREKSSFPGSLAVLRPRLAFSPNSKILAWKSDNGRDGKVLLYDVSANKYLSSDLSGECFAFSPDSQWLAIGEKEGFCLWHIDSRKAVARKRVGHAIDIAFSPDGRTLAVNSKVQDGLHAIHLWRWHADDKSGLGLEKLSPLIIAPRDEEFSLLTFSPDGRILAARHGSMETIHREASDGIIHLWETATGQERACFNNHGSYVTSLMFAPDGRRLASGHENGTILIWDVTGGRKTGKLHLAHLSDDTLAALWDDLASHDATRASHALWQLTSAGPHTVSFFKTKLHPLREKKVPAALLMRLIADLDNETFAVRQKARQELHQLGKSAEMRLRQVLKKEISVEMRRTVQELLKKIEEEYVARALSPKDLRGVRALEVLGQIGHIEARRLLETLASGDAEAGLTQEAQATLIYWKNTHKPY